MGVYLPNVDMPKDCMGCQFGVDGLCVAMNPARTRNWSAKETTNYCPLVPVPPHGRLIDADALEKDIDKYIGGEESRSRFHHWVQVQRTVIHESEEAHT